MSSLGSVTRLIELVNQGDDTAARQLWDRFSERLRSFARTTLPERALGIADEDDVVLSALATFFTGAEQGKFPYVRDRRDLWHLLAIITKRKALDLIASERRKKRAPTLHRPPSSGDALPDLDRAQGVNSLASPNAPDFHVLMKDQCQWLLDLLGDETLRAIAVWRLEGYTAEEISGMLSCTVRTVERKIRLIRTIWSEENHE
jgi:DNA-directed RNA polymerase specialized sigma24 family protein